MNIRMVRTIFNVYYNGEKNFMTPDVIGYRQKTFGDEILLFEKSSGTGLFNQELYGCTILIYNKITDEVQASDLSKSFNTGKELDNYIDGLTEADVETAGRHGEIKVII